MELKTILPIIELIHNIMYIAAAYNQIWTVKAIDTESGEHTIVLIDERNGKEKLVFHNPDRLMAEFIEEVRAEGWEEIRRKYLKNPENFDNMRVRLCDSEYNRDCRNRH